MQTQIVFGILVIRSDDSRAHIYRDTNQLLASLAPGAGEDLGGVEFFSRAGHRLAPVFDPKWRMQGLVQTADEPRPDVVLRRLRATVERMRDYLRANPDVVARAGLRVDDGLARLPSLPDASLDEAIQAWSMVLSHELGSHSADPWHNFWVHGIL